MSGGPLTKLQQENLLDYVHTAGGDEQCIVPIRDLEAVTRRAARVAVLERQLEEAAKALEEIAGYEERYAYRTQHLKAVAADARAALARLSGGTD